MRNVSSAEKTFSMVDESMGTSLWVRTIQSLLPEVTTFLDKLCDFAVRNAPGFQSPSPTRRQNLGHRIMPDS